MRKPSKSNPPCPFCSNHPTTKIGFKKNKKILLVATVSRTGKTLEKAKELLEGNKIKTFVINAKAGLFSL